MTRRSTLPFPIERRKFATLGFLAAAALSLSALTGCPPNTTDKKVVFAETGAEAVELMTKPRGTFGLDGKPNAVWLDPRGETEFAAGHIAGAKNLPFPRLDAEHEVVLKGVEVIVVYDNDFDDTLVKAVAKRLIAGGHKEVYVLRGGLKAWKREGNSIETGTGTAKATG